MLIFSTCPIPIKFHLKGPRFMPVFFLLVLLLIAPSVQSAEPPDQYSFAASLAEENDHYRAITEYKRFLHYFPADPRAPEARLGIAKSLLAGQRWQQSDEALEKVWIDYPGSPEALEARRLYAQSALDRKDYALARKRYQQIEQLSPEDKELSSYQTGLSYLEEGRLPEARKHFSTMPEPAASQLNEQLTAFENIPRKSPRVAGALSAILPGAGQLYTERPKQAGMAFALNAAFIYGAIEAWNNENYTVAGILSLFEIGWYGGNIYNAANNAHKINRKREARLKEKILKGLSLSYRNNTPLLETKIRF